MNAVIGRATSLDPVHLFWFVVIALVLMLGAFAAGVEFGSRGDEP